MADVVDEPFKEYGGEWKLIDFIDKLQGILEEIEPEYRGRAMFEHVGDLDTGGYIRVWYPRPQTPEEIEAEAAWRAEWKAKEIARERDQYEYLKRKFEKMEG